MFANAQTTQFKFCNRLECVGSGTWRTTGFGQTVTQVELAATQKGQLVEVASDLFQHNGDAFRLIHLYAFCCQVMSDKHLHNYKTNTATASKSEET